MPADALARIPDGLDPVQAAPFGCAGVTTYNALRHARLEPGSRVAVFGIGGLGHLAVQFASRMGYHTSGHLTGSPRDIERAMSFALTTGVRPITTVLPLAEAAHGVDLVRSGQARYRIVLTTDILTGDATPASATPET